MYEGKFRGICLPHPHAASSCTWGRAAPATSHAGGNGADQRVSSADLTPIEHHLDDKGFPGTVTEPTP
jgi:hypothetical protein